MENLFVVYGEDEGRKSFFGFYPTEELAQARIDGLPVEERLGAMSIVTLPWSETEGVSQILELTTEVTS